MRAIGINNTKRQKTTSLMSAEKLSPFNFMRTEKPQVQTLSKILFGSDISKPVDFKEKSTPST